MGRAGHDMFSGHQRVDLHRIMYSNYFRWFMYFEAPSIQPEFLGYPLQFVLNFGNLFVNGIHCRGFGAAVRRYPTSATGSFAFKRARVNPTSVGKPIQVIYY